MIARYSRPAMQAIWQDANRFRLWYLIEAEVLQAMADLGEAPKEAAEALWKLKPLFDEGRADAARILEIEAETKHDVIAFLTYLAEQLGEPARWVHQGMTSSDLLDSALALQLKDAGGLLLEGLDLVLAALKERAFEHKLTPTVGRSHGIHAEPTTFGLKLAGHYAAFDRAKSRLQRAIEEVSTLALSGAVGTFANIDPQIEERVGKALGLRPEPISTQIVPRDRHAAFFTTLGLIASSVENFAIEVRHLQRSELREAEEFFSRGQKGSSAMPHKRNPVLSENLTGLARIVRAAVVPALENVALWHERDISHSSVERVFAPDATIALDFALHRMAALVKGLVVYPDAMTKNLEAQGGLVHSQRVLLALIQAGVSREEAYSRVQRNAMKAWQEGKDFRAELLSDAEITAVLSREKIEACFDLSYHFKQVDRLFERVFGAASSGS